MSKKKLVVFSGAGVSAESGIPTFRGNDGLWENHKMEDVATPDGFERNPKMVLEFYNGMRERLKDIQPNSAHKIIAELEKDFDVVVVTQNIDDLHERGGSTNVIHVHGELLKSRSTIDPGCKYPCEGDINIGDVCEHGGQLRPDIVWFKEAVYRMDEAQALVGDCDILLVIGTSLNVWPSAGLVKIAPSEVFCIDPKHVSVDKRVCHIQKVATEGMVEFRRVVLNPDRVLPSPEAETRRADVLPPVRKLH